MIVSDMLLMRSGRFVESVEQVLSLQTIKENFGKIKKIVGFTFFF